MDSKMDRCRHLSRRYTHQSIVVWRPVFDCPLAPFHSSQVCRQEFVVLLPKSPCPSHERPLESAGRTWRRLAANLPKDPLQKLRPRLDPQQTSPRSSSDTETQLQVPTMPARWPPARLRQMFTSINRRLQKEKTERLGKQEEAEWKSLE